MNTDHLIRVLAADQKPSAVSLQHLVGGALIAGAVAATALFLWRIKLRPDFSIALHEPTFALKFLVTMALAIPAVGLLWRLIRPGSQRRFWAVALMIAPALLAAGVLYELMRFDPSVWSARLVGRNAMFCLKTIPLLAAPVLLALFLAMRKGAPTHPALAGAAAGLAAGAIGATLYAAHCTDDSPLFVMAWYSLAIALVTAGGALAGRSLLRW